MQWHEGVEAAFREIIVRHGKQTADPDPLIHAFHTEDRRHRDMPPWNPYREVLRYGLGLAIERDRPLTSPFEERNMSRVLAV